MQARSPGDTFRPPQALTAGSEPTAQGAPSRSHAG
jgi:hypothetical protein